MYTFKKYLQETKLPELTDSFEKKIFDQLFEIANNIEPFVKAIGGPKNLIKNVLWRGVSTNITAPIDIKTIRKNRRPKDTEKNVSKVVDNWFLKNFKSRFRSNAIFASGDKKLADDFGLPAVIIPKENFSFVWSPKVEDLLDEKIIQIKSIELLKLLKLTSTIKSIKEKTSIGEVTLKEIVIKRMLKNNKLNFSAEDLIKEITSGIQDGLDKSKYNSTGLIAAIKSLNEIMISGKEYYVLSDISKVKGLLRRDKFESIIPEENFNLPDEIFILSIIALIFERKITR